MHLLDEDSMILRAEAEGGARVELNAHAALYPVKQPFKDCVSWHCLTPSALIDGL